MENDNIADAIRRFSRNEACDAEKAIVYDYIMSDPSRFEILVENMRNAAMLELGLDPADDFLPGHLEKCSPSEFAISAAFGEYRKRVSASNRASSLMRPIKSFIACDGDLPEEFESIDIQTEFVSKDMFAILRDALLVHPE
ncbi:MAG: hypothetical protein K2F63_02040 [Muribaculaceae bacterium]|nr:hypothetical protein [Muribaculaceae bacterium]MDE6135311.1 hypothetical protein [Muribaculaceae bacterium]